MKRIAFNVALKTALVRLRKSQVALMHETGISESRLSRIIHGHLPATGEEKRAIARALRCKVGDLFPSDGNREAVA